MTERGIQRIVYFLAGLLAVWALCVYYYKTSSALKSNGNNTNRIASGMPPVTDPDGVCADLDQPIKVAAITQTTVLHVFHTAYDPNGKSSVGRRATLGNRPTKYQGRMTDDAGIATDNEVIPVGSQILMPDNRIILVDDTGCDMRHASRGLEARVSTEPFYHIDERPAARYRPGWTLQTVREDVAQRAASNNGYRSEMDVCVIPPGHSIQECPKAFVRYPSSPRIRNKLQIMRARK